MYSNCSNAVDFFYRVMLCNRGICCHRVSVCLSVTSPSSNKTAKPIGSCKQRHTSTRTPVLNISVKFQRSHPNVESQIQMGQVKSGDFRPMSCYISETVQDRDIHCLEKQYTWLLIITAANVERFLKFFHGEIPRETPYVTITGPSTSPWVLLLL